MLTIRTISLEVSSLLLDSSFHVFTENGTGESDGSQQCGLLHPTASLGLCSNLSPSTELN